MKGSYNLIPIQDLLDTSLPDDSTKQTLRGGEDMPMPDESPPKISQFGLRLSCSNQEKKKKKREISGQLHKLLIPRLNGKSQSNCTSYSVAECFQFYKLRACVLVNLLSTVNETKSNVQRRPAESQTNQKRSKSSWFDSLSRKYMCIINSVVSIWVQIVIIKRDL